MTRMLLSAITVLLLCSSAMAQDATAPSADDRLLIVNGNTGHVVYDDGRDDLFCVTRRVVIGHTDEGRRVYRRTMTCR